MAIYSSQQVINKAASDLGKWVPGEALGEVEQDTISAAYDNVISEVSKIISFDREECPDTIFEVISSMTAAFAASSFSNVPIDYTNAIRPLEGRLRYLVAQSPTYEPVAAFFF